MRLVLKDARTLNPCSFKITLARAPHVRAPTYRYSKGEQVKQHSVINEMVEIDHDNQHP